MRSSADRSLAWAVALALAVFAASGGYYWVHKPIQPEQAAALARALADLAAALLMATLAGGLGRRIWSAAAWPAPGERALAQAGLGWGALALGMLAIGLLNGYSSALAWGGLLLGLALTRRAARAWWGDVAQAARALWVPGRLGRAAALFTAGALTLGLLQALAPPLKWDALVYHLTLPLRYAQSGGLRPDLALPFSGMPHLTEMLYTLALLLRGPQAAQALGWCFGALLTLGVSGQAAHLLGPRAGALAAAILLASFTISQELAWAYVDLLVMVYALAALAALRQWATAEPSPGFPPCPSAGQIFRPLRGGPHLSGLAHLSAGAQACLPRADLWLAGLFCGLALSCKYTAAVVALGALAVVVYQLASSQPLTAWKTWAASLLGFLLPLAAVFAPWLLKNWAFTGNPFYPLFIPAGEMDALRLAFYGRPDPAQANLFKAALIFFRAVFLGVPAGNGFDASLTPVLVWGPLALAFAWRRLHAGLRQHLAPLAVFAGVGYAGWVGLLFISGFAIQPRLFFGLFPPLVVLSAAGLQAAGLFDRPALRLSFVLGGALALTLSLSALELGLDFLQRQPLAVLAGLQSPADYRAARLGWYAPALEQVNALPAGSRVLFLWEPRSLECQSAARCRPDALVDRWWHARQTLGGPPAILADWRARGVTHVLVYTAGLRFVQTEANSPFSAADWQALDQLLGQLKLQTDLGGVYALYAVP